MSEKKDNIIICHISFQSTGGANSVNALSSLELYVREQNKGRGNQKRIWGIEMNEARETYHKNYSAVNKIQQMLLQWNVTYESWRWWHAPTRHAKAIAMSMAYSLCLQCAKCSVILSVWWLLFQDQGFDRRCLFRWYSTIHQT